MGHRCGSRGRSNWTRGSDKRRAELRRSALSALLPALLVRCSGPAGGKPTREASRRRFRRSPRHGLVWRLPSRKGARSRAARGWTSRAHPRSRRSAHTRRPLLHLCRFGNRGLGPSTLPPGSWAVTETNAPPLRLHETLPIPGRVASPLARWALHYGHEPPISTGPRNRTASSGFSRPSFSVC
jgi:hypothetical protein